jgi:hypothetical protein
MIFAVKTKTSVSVPPVENAIGRYDLMSNHTDCAQGIVHDQRIRQGVERGNPMSDAYDNQRLTPFNEKQAVAKFGPHVKKKRRKIGGRRKAARSKTDGRSLQATGRTEHLNFRTKPAIRTALHTHVGHGRQSLWLEEAILAKFRSEGIDVDA